MRMFFIYIVVGLFLVVSCDNDDDNINSGTSECGNNVVETGEECDGSDFTNSCFNAGYWYGDPQSCDETCKLVDASACHYAREWGSSEDDDGISVAADKAGNVYVAGYTEGAIDGNTQQGGGDAFLTKYDIEGNELWTKQWGTSLQDQANAVAADEDGNVYAAGYLDNGSTAFLTKYDIEGNELWTKQWDSSGYCIVNSIAMNEKGDLYVVGYTDGALGGNANQGGVDVFLIKLDGEGNELWIKQWGSSEDDEGYSVILDKAGDIYVTGSFVNDHAEDQTPVTDIFLTKLDGEGNELWTEQWGGTFWDVGYSVGIDSKNNIYVTGHTHESLDGNTYLGYYDAFLTKFDSDGNKLWTKQWGTSEGDDKGNTVIIDSQDNIYVTGHISHEAAGQNEDIFLTKFDGNGNELWTKKWGVYQFGGENRAAADAFGGIYITGNQKGSFDDNPTAGGWDVLAIRTTIDAP